MGYKQYKKEKMTLIEDALHLSAVDHTCKQVQMHAAAKSIALRFAKKAPPSFHENFHFYEFFSPKLMISLSLLKNMYQAFFRSMLTIQATVVNPHQRNTNMFMPELKLFAIFHALTPTKK